MKTILCRSAIVLAGILLILSSAHETLGAGAVLFMSPAIGSYGVGSTFTASVTLDSGGGTGVNASEGTINFDKTALSVSNVSKSNSIFTLWPAEPNFSNAAGTVKFSGGSPSTYTKKAGVILQITFKALKVGSTDVSIIGGSALAADGRGTEILSKSVKGTYTITEGQALPPAPPPPSPSTQSFAPSAEAADTSAPKISSPTHPDENKWYNSRDPKFTWQLPNGAAAISLVVDKDPATVPSVVYKPAVAEKTIVGLDDGVWFFHLQLKTDIGGWGKTGHRKVMIDSTPPDSPQVEIKKDDASDPRPRVLATTTDKASGLDHYEVSVDGGNTLTVSLLDMENVNFRLPKQNSGHHKIIVRVFDKAGNASENAAEFDIQAEEGVAQSAGPGWLWWLMLALSLLLNIAAGWYIRRLRNENFLLRKDAARSLEEYKSKIDDVFTALRQEVEDQIMYLDDKMELSESERTVMKKLKDALEMSDELMKKEADEIEKKLK